MAFPTVKYDATNGSDTAASGAGPTTAVTGTNAYSGDGAGGGTQTEINVSGDSPDLSGIATDGSAVLWLNTSSGDRHLFKITGVNDGTDIITIEAAPDNGISSGAAVSWAVGGERKTLENDSSNGDYNDWQAGWTIELQGDGSNYDVTSNINLSGDITDGFLTIRSENPGTVQPVLRTTSGSTNAFEFGEYTKIDGLKIVNTQSPHYVVLVTLNGYTRLSRCEVDGASGAVQVESGGPVIEDCRISTSDGSSSAVYFNHRGVALIARTVIPDTAGTGISLASAYAHRGSAVFIEDCVIYGSGGVGIHGSSWFTTESSSLDHNQLVIHNCTLYDCGSDGIALNGSNFGQHSVIIKNNVIAGCAAYGLNVSATVEPLVTADYNHYHNNTSGNYNSSRGQGDNDTTGDPLFTSTTGGSEDFTPGSGSPLIDAGTPVETA
jgi:hypothetical protein